MTPAGALPPAGPTARIGEEVDQVEQRQSGGLGRLPVEDGEPAVPAVTKRFRGEKSRCSQTTGEALQASEQAPGLRQGRGLDHGSEVQLELVEHVAGDRPADAGWSRRVGWARSISQSVP